jgi:hypothetical protein
MSALVMGLFERREDADTAVRRALAAGYRGDVTDVALYEDELPNEEVDQPGSSSGRQAKRGALLAGLIGAFLGGALLWPILGLLSPAVGAALGGAAGVLYGTLAGLLSGRDLPKPAVEHAREELEEGKVLVTVEVDSRATAREVEELLLDAGSRDVQVA